MTRDDFPNWDQTPSGSRHWLRWWIDTMDTPGLRDLCDWCTIGGHR